MHGIEKVTDRIAQDAQAEIEAQLSQAQERADQILAEYETQAREAVERILAHGQREVDAHRAQLHSMARLEARKRVLAAKQDVIEAAFEKALARLCALPREKMVPLLARLAAVYAETGEEEVILPPASRRAYGQDVVDQANQLIGEGHLTLGQAVCSCGGAGSISIVPFPCFCSDGGNRSVPKWQRFSFPEESRCERWMKEGAL